MHDWSISITTEVHPNFHQTELCPVFNITRVITLFRTTLGTHHHEDPEIYSFWELVSVEKGMLSVQIGDESFDVSSGQVILYPPNIPHYFQRIHEDGCRIGIVSFVSPSEQEAHLRALAARIYTLRSEERHLLQQILQEGSKVLRDLGSSCPEEDMSVPEDTPQIRLFKLKLRMETLLTAISEYETVKPESSANRKNRNTESLQKVRAFMQEHLTSHLTVEQIAAGCGMSVSMLKRLFREQTGQGVMAYLNDLRMTEAMRLIRTSTLNLAEISERLGFSSQFYFSRAFRNHVGISPSEYGRRVKQEPEE